MPPNCKCCVSSNRQRYELERKKNRLSYPKLSELAKELGESISHQAFFRHFSPWHKTKEQRVTYIPKNRWEPKINMDINEY